MTMLDEDWRRAQERFLEALETPDSERAAFVARVRTTDPDLATQVEQLLAAHEGPGLAIENFLEGLSREPDSGAEVVGTGLGALAAGTRVGPFRVECLVGSGGMGEVYEAFRDDGQFRQRVALKVLRPGYLAAELVQRFEQERQILARLEHPSIVRIIDGGLLRDGRPYLVMEFVEGCSITEHCERGQLGTRTRLRLFGQVCAAVQYAHGQLVVHRDLKPGNILVEPAGTPKLLDFGIAKLLDAATNAESAADPATRPQARLMTPERAAPEQLRGEPVTTATDVYALGLLLRDLLGGTGEWARVSVDLRRIVAKATEASPALRYVSAGQLGEDIERFLSGLPVRARAHTIGYRTRRYVVRHRLALGIVLAFASLLGSFGLVSARQAERVARERDAANHERATAERVVGILTGLFERSNPVKVPGGDTMRVATFVEDAADGIEDIEDPAVRARLWQTVAAIHGVRSEFERAEDMLTRAHETWVELKGPDARESAMVEFQIARMGVLQAKDSRQRPRLRAAVERLIRVLPPRDTALVDAYVNLALATDDLDERRRLLDEADRVAATLNEGSVIPHASRLHVLASVELDQGRPDRALPLYQETARLLRSELPAGHPHVNTVESNAAAMLNQMGRFAEASRLQEAILERMAASGDTATMQAAIRTMNLGVSLANQGSLEKSEATLRRAQRIMEGLVDPDHDQVISNARNLAMVLAHRGQVDEGVQILEEILASKDTADEASGAAVYQAHLSALYRWRGDTERGYQMAQVSASKQEGNWSAQDPRRAATQRMVGLAALTAGHPREAERHLTRAVELAERLSPHDTHPQIDAGRCALGVALRETGDSAFDPTAMKASCRRYRDRWGMADPMLLEFAGVG